MAALEDPKQQNIVNTPIIGRHRKKSLETIDAAVFLNFRLIFFFSTSPNDRDVLGCQTVWLERCLSSQYTAVYQLSLELPLSGIQFFNKYSKIIRGKKSKSTQTHQEKKNCWVPIAYGTYWLL